MVKRKRAVQVFAVFAVIIGMNLFAEGQQGFKAEKISNQVLVMRNPADNTGQLAIVSKKGIVMLDTFWSKVTADRFRQQWIKALNRDDFIYTINTVDRLDCFGGNGSYKETTIIGHQSFLEKFELEAATAEINDLIKMWRWKEDVSRKRLPTHKPGSKEEEMEKKWLKTCKQRADELEQAFQLLLPQVVYKDRMQIHLGDVTIRLIYFGKAGYDGLTIVVIPEEKVAIIPGFILHSQHLAPHPHPNYVKLDVPRWIAVFEEILAETSKIEKIVCWTDVWPKQRAVSHLRYIKTLWDQVSKLEAIGKSLEEIQKMLSLESGFSFVKDMAVYREHGDSWVRPQHRAHVKGFYLQHKKMATAMIKTEMKQVTVQQALKKVLDEKVKDKSIYIDESSLTGLGYQLLGSGKTEDAIAVFKVIVEMYPKSFNAYDSLAEGYMKKGDKERAINNYNKSLKLNPENNNARKMIEKFKNK